MCISECFFNINKFYHNGEQSGKLHVSYHTRGVNSHYILIKIYKWKSQITYGNSKVNAYLFFLLIISLLLWIRDITIIIYNKI